MSLDYKKWTCFKLELWENLSTIALAFAFVLFLDVAVVVRVNFDLLNAEAIVVECGTDILLLLGQRGYRLSAFALVQGHARPICGHERLRQPWSQSIF